MDACNVPSWKEQLAKMSLDTLTLSDFTTAPPIDGEFDLSEFARRFVALSPSRSRMSDYNIGYIEGDYAGLGGYNRTKQDNLTVKNLGDVYVMVEFLTAIYATKFCFYHPVNTDMPYKTAPLLHRLRLENVPELNYYIQPGFAAFLNRPNIVDCEEFSDSYLEAISHCCEPLPRLYLVDYPGNTVKGLKVIITAGNKLVSRKARASESDDEDEELRRRVGRSSRKSRGGRRRR